MAGIDFSKASSAYQNSANLQSAKNITTMQESSDLAEEGNQVGFKPSFDELIAQGLDNARDSGYKGEAISAEAVAGKAEYHKLIAAVNNSDLVLKTVVATRDRIINAYQDILKMPI